MSDKKKEIPLREARAAIFCRMPLICALFATLSTVLLRRPDRRPGSIVTGGQPERCDAPGRPWLEVEQIDDDNQMIKWPNENIMMMMIACSLPK